MQEGRQNYIQEIYHYAKLVIAITYDINVS